MTAYKDRAYLKPEDADAIRAKTKTFQSCAVLGDWMEDDEGVLGYIIFVHPGNDGAPMPDYTTGTRGVPFNVKPFSTIEALDAFMLSHGYVFNNELNPYVALTEQLLAH